MTIKVILRIHEIKTCFKYNTDFKLKPWKLIRNINAWQKHFSLLKPVKRTFKYCDNKWKKLWVSKRLSVYTIAILYLIGINLSLALSFPTNKDNLNIHFLILMSKVHEPIN